jgi:hypothetical protein
LGTIARNTPGAAMTHSHNNEPITKFIDIFELMDCLRVSRTTIKRWNSNGAMPAV